MRARSAVCGLFCEILASVGLLTLAGCGSGGIPTYYVTGTVLVDGQPAEGAIVVYCPVDGSDEVMSRRPMGTTDADGRYELTTFEPGDGAPAGDYKVVIEWPGPPQRDDRGGRPRLGPDRLKGKYLKLADSTITAKVEAHSNEIPPFELTSK